MPDQVNSAKSESNRPLRILYLGRLEQIQKRVRLFPVILRQLKDAGIPFNWTIAGDGPERSALEQQMKDTASDQRVSFVGKVAYADVPKLLANHDVFLLASDYEGLPLSLLEAAGHGLVPVVSDLPSGIREIVDETTGIRVAPENVAGYAAAVIRLHQQRDQLEALSRGAREKVQGAFSVTAMTDRWLAAIPVATPQTPVWPREFKIQPILGARNKWWFSAPARILRRAVIKWRR
jgi:glycosyltransferase involved in cell wall biosynthesis